jgi:hypothetical protein
MLRKKGNGPVGCGRMWRAVEKGNIPKCGAHTPVRCLCFFCPKLPALAIRFGLPRILHRIAGFSRTGVCAPHNYGSAKARHSLPGPGPSLFGLVLPDVFDLLRETLVGAEHVIERLVLPKRAFFAEQLIDVAANLVSGNSGSPVFYVPAGAGGITLGGTNTRPMLIGVQSVSIISADVGGMTLILKIFSK